MPGISHQPGTLSSQCYPGDPAAPPGTSAISKHMQYSSLFITTAQTLSNGFEDDISFVTS